MCLTFDMRCDVIYSDKATKAKLLQPLVFALQFRIGPVDNPMVSTLHVHQGDLPAQLAQAFVARYNNWDDPKITATKVEEAILAKVEELNAKQGKTTTEDATGQTTEE